MAATNTRFLRIYWVNIVGLKNPWKHSFGKKNKGVNVSPICSNPKITASFRYLPLRKSIPKLTSQRARSLMEMVAGINPLSSLSIVLIANPSAGLYPGKNFRSPKEK